MAAPDESAREAMSRALPVFPVTLKPMREGVDPSVMAMGDEVEAVGPEGGTRIALVTLGCDKNTVDSEHIMAALVGEGARVSSELEGSDVVIVNTCGFIEAAKAQTIETILEVCEMKSAGQVGAVIAVGCMVERYKSELEREMPEVDLYLGLGDLPALLPALRERGLIARRPTVPLMERPLRVLSTSTPHSSFLKISEGCDHSCAFCAIPLMRGLHRSAPLEHLVGEARSLGRAGVRELNVVSQDTTWYGRDGRRRDRDAPLLPDLLRALLRETEVDWYRLFYMYPSGISRELVDLIAESSITRDKPRTVPYLDMPIQHGCDRMLQVMKRPERRRSIRERVAWLRAAIPALTLRTTVIVGFPTESDEDFRELLDLLEEIRFDRVGAFAYSLEEGTAAAEMGGQVPESLKRERLEELTDLQRSVSLERNLEEVGSVRPLIVDEIGERLQDGSATIVGRTEGQAKDVDGVTRVRLGNGTQVRPGDFLDVRIEGAEEHDLLGTVSGA